MAWIALLLAGLLEIVWATSMKLSHGFTRLTPSLVTLVAMALSFWLLSVAMRTLPLGTAYAVWTGIGTVGTVLLGILLFGEAATAIRLACVSHHYRSAWEWTDGLMPAASERLSRWVAAGEGSGALEQVRAALDSDLDTPGAIEAIDDAAASGLGVSEAAALLGVRTDRTVFESAT